MTFLIRRNAKISKFSTKHVVLIISIRIGVFRKTANFKHQTSKKNFVHQAKNIFEVKTSKSCDSQNSYRDVASVILYFFKNSNNSLE